ncbi:MAG: methyltransferase domain-containing protein [Acidobacteria bacterium]|nr:MAG: methyltransferase domain-containing protein [Acidobacteriota bacterium]
MTSTPKELGDVNLVQRPAALAGIEARTQALGFDMASEPRTGALLQALAASKPGGRLLELGTGTGVATAWILAGMDAHATLTSVDVSSAHQQVASEFLASDSRLTLVLEDGLQFLKRQPSESFDFVFADAIPGKYEGLEECLKVVKPGGAYVVDDMLPLPRWPRAHVERVLLLTKQLAGDDRFAIAPLDWATGVIVAVRR